MTPLIICDGDGALLEGEGQTLHVAAVGAYHDFKVTGFEHVVQVLVVELEQFCIDGESYQSALARLEGDALKSLEFLHGTGDTAHHVADVELNDLGTLAVTRVGD